jgi:hypothetical protein
MTSLRRPLIVLTHARARIAAAAILILAAWEIGVLVSARDAAPTREEWQAVANAMPSELRPDQLIMFAPAWIDPVGRRWLGDRLSLEQVGRMDAARYREIWEVSVRGASAPEVARASPVSEQTFGPIRLRRFVRDAPAITWSSRDGAHICEVDFMPRLGLAFELRHPFAQGRRVFQTVSLGNELQVYAGLADYKLRTLNRSGAIVQAMVDGREVTRAVVGNEDGWVALPPARTVPGPHTLEIITRVQPRGPVDLSVCVAAEARRYGS